MKVRFKHRIFLSALITATVVCAFAVSADAQQKKTSGQKDKNASVEVYHTVKSGETIFGISKKYGVSSAEIKKWNKLKGSSIRAGQKLIVGYSKKKPAVIEKKVEKKTAPPSPGSVKEIPKTPPPPAAKPVKQEKKKEKIIESEAVPMKDISEEGIASWIDDEDVNTGKYYALHRTAPIGTIVKVTNTANQKIVYVKVVGKIPAREEFAVIIMQISKGASDKLEVNEARFNAVLNYSVPE